MKSKGLEKLAELVSAQHRAINKNDTALEILKDASDSLEAFGDACRNLLGLQLDWVLHAILLSIQEQQLHLYQSADLTRNAPEEVLSDSQSLCDAAKLLHKIQIQQGCSLVHKSEAIVRSIGDCHSRLRRRMDPQGNIQNKADPAVNPNQRNLNRDIYIYHSRKDEKRSFADIARELGISAGRVSQLYKRIDYALNGDAADHHQPGHPKRDIIIDGVKIQRNQTEKRECNAENSIIIPFPESES